jgi:hypothetical protein
LDVATVTLSAFEIKRYEKVVAEFIERRRPPPRLRKDVDLTFRINRQCVEIFEISANWTGKGKPIEHRIAKATLNESEDAAKVTEQRLGVSSLSLHGAAHLAPFLPQPMQDIGTSMHQAASRLVIVLQNASVTPTADAFGGINKALHAVTTACEACHAHYSLR